MHNAYFGQPFSSRLAFSAFIRALTLDQASITKVRNTKEYMTCPEGIKVVSFYSGSMNRSAVNGVNRDNGGIYA